jgi:hypothetical protein
MGKRPCSGYRFSQARPPEYPDLASSSGGRRRAQALQQEHTELCSPHPLDLDTPAGSHPASARSSFVGESIPPPAHYPAEPFSRRRLDLILRFLSSSPPPLLGFATWSCPVRRLLWAMYSGPFLLLRMCSWPCVV